MRLSWPGQVDVIGIGDGGQGRPRRLAAMLVGMDDMGVITVRDLRRRYDGTRGGGFDAVRGVTFSVRRGELFALLGTNGAGKTSTMELLEGLAPPAQGAVRVLGSDPYRDRARVRHRVGIMLQEGGFAPDLTVAETGRMWAGTLSASRPVAEALELVGLGHRARVAVRSLSGGERRRLDLAMAILGRPEVLFLDEPTTGLDPEGRRSTWLLVRRLLGSGTTAVLTTHYLEEAEELADRLAIMHRGLIVRMGTPAEVAASQPARISFELPEDWREPVPDMAGTRASVTGRRATLQPADLQPTLTALLGWANSRGLVLGALHARAASLEEAFLAMAASSGQPADVNDNEADVAA
ncbi:MAG TPA: ABC transporter ATP-binding protein [Streptosporangiaceae bacterium]|nr:ABC transporter ATP-binding protein [Streptosporangiaceae bacterium]